jgi:hypothetical protein
MKRTTGRLISRDPELDPAKVPRTGYPYHVFCISSNPLADPAADPLKNSLRLAPLYRALYSISWDILSLSGAGLTAARLSIATSTHQGSCKNTDSTFEMVPRLLPRQPKVDNIMYLLRPFHSCVPSFCNHQRIPLQTRFKKYAGCGQRYPYTIEVLTCPQKRGQKEHVQKLSVLGLSSGEIS